MSRIQGNLPWQSMAGAAGAFQGLAGSPQQAVQSLGTNYANAYNSALSMNQALYQNILGGYQDTLSSQTTAQDAIQRGYSDLYNNVLGQINQVGGARQQAINDQYAANSGQATQGLISRGLGNSTVTQSVQRGIEADRQKANLALSDDLAQMRAGYMSQLGQAGLQFGERAYGQNTALNQNQLNWMNSVSAPYPEAGQYAALAQQYGAYDQANQDRAQAAGQFAALQRAATPGGPMVTTPVVPGAVSGGGSSGGFLGQGLSTPTPGPPLYGAGGPSTTGTNWSIPTIQGSGAGLGPDVTGGYSFYTGDPNAPYPSSDTSGSAGGSWGDEPAGGTYELPTDLNMFGWG